MHIQMLSLRLPWHPAYQPESSIYYNLRGRGGAREKQACVEQALPLGLIRPYHWGTGFYLPWGALEGLGRGKVGFCSFDRRPGRTGVLAKGTREKDPLFC